MVKKERVFVSQKKLAFWIFCCIIIGHESNRANLCDERIVAIKSTGKGEET